MIDDILVKKLAKTIAEAPTKKSSPYDTQAEVRRIDGNTAWVHIPGGINETPVQLTTNAKKGDIVQVRVSGGRAWLYGNATAPPTDDTKANEASNKASVANEHATNAITSAMLAQQSANDAKEAADSAQSDAATAHTKAEQAIGDAARAETAASNAQTSANNANTAASNAQSAANNALTQLGIVEDVVGTLDWISQHATYKASTDTSVVPGKLYFTLSGTTYTPVSNPTGNPSTSGYYEIDDITDAVSNYVSSHLSLTNAGLWVVNDNNSYKILLASDGMKVYDASGNLVSTFGESITFSSTRAQYIGDEDAYIIFNGDGQITIGGSVILGSSESLSDILNAVDNTLIYDHSYVYTYDESTPPKPISATFTAHVYKGGVDVAQTDYRAADFTWYIKTEEGEESLGSGFTKVVTLAESGYGAEIIGKFTVPEDSVALTNDGDTLTDNDNTPISVRATGDTVRVRDLTTSTTIFDTDKLLVVGGEDEHLITFETLQDYLNANLDKQVLFNTTSGWNSQTTLVSKVNTIYIYTDHQTDSSNNHIPGIKVGDGNAYVVDLPFSDDLMTSHMSDTTKHITSSERTTWNSHISNSTVHVTASDKAAWNEKVRCYYAGEEQLVFTNTPSS